MLCHWGVWVEVTALCVPEGALQPLQEESGPSETGTQSTMRDKFEALGVIAFFCSHLLAMHVARRVKTSALLIGDI